MRIIEEFSKSMPDWIKDSILSNKYGRATTSPRFTRQRAGVDPRETTLQEFLKKYDVDLSRVKFVKADIPTSTNDININSNDRIPIWHIKNMLGGEDQIFIGGNRKNNDPDTLTFKLGMNGNELWSDSFNKDNFLEISKEHEVGITDKNDILKKLADPTTRIFPDANTDKLAGLPFKAFNIMQLSAISDDFCYIDLLATSNKYDNKNYNDPDAEKYPSFSFTDRKWDRETLDKSLRDPVNVDIFKYVKDSDGQVHRDVQRDEDGNIITDEDGNPLKTDEVAFSYNRKNDYYRNEPGKYQGINNKGQILDLNGDEVRDFIDKSGYVVDLLRYGRELSKVEMPAKFRALVSELDRISAEVSSNKFIQKVISALKLNDNKNFNDTISIHTASNGGSVQGKNQFSQVSIYDYLSSQCVYIKLLYGLLNNVASQGFSYKNQAEIDATCAVIKPFIECAKENIEILYKYIGDTNGAKVASITPKRVVNNVPVFRRK